MRPAPRATPRTSSVRSRVIRCSPVVFHFYPWRADLRRFKGRCADTVQVMLGPCRRCLRQGALEKGGRIVHVSKAIMRDAQFAVRPVPFVGEKAALRVKCMP